MATRAMPIAEFASVGDLIGSLTSSLAASTPGPLSSLVSTLGDDLAMTVDLQPSAGGLGRLAVRSMLASAAVEHMHCSQWARTCSYLLWLESSSGASTRLDRHGRARCIM